MKLTDKERKYVEAFDDQVPKILKTNYKNPLFSPIAVATASTMHLQLCNIQPQKHLGLDITLQPLPSSLT